MKIKTCDYYSIEEKTRGIKHKHPRNMTLDRYRCFSNYEPLNLYNSGRRQENFLTVTYFLYQTLLSD